MNCPNMDRGRALHHPGLRGRLRHGRTSLHDLLLDDGSTRDLIASRFESEFAVPWARPLHAHDSDDEVGDVTSGST